MGFPTESERAEIEARFPDCMACGAPFYAHGIGTGYGWTRDGRRICYACCAEDERGAMTRDGRAVLYLVRRGARWFVTDWAGKLSFPVLGEPWRFRHPFAREAWAARFRGPDGALWSAHNIGDSQIAHVRRMGERAQAAFRRGRVT